MNTYYRFRGLNRCLIRILNHISNMVLPSATAQKPPFVFVTQPTEITRLPNDMESQYIPITLVYESIIMTDDAFVAAHPEFFNDGFNFFTTYT
jgi:hypothetical protein